MEQSAWLYGLNSVDIWQTKYVQLVAILICFQNILIPICILSKVIFHICKTLVTLTKPTVGRQLVGQIGRQSADFVPYFSCFLVGWLKKKYN